jgi:hypothetical protein
MSDDVRPRLPKDQLKLLKFRGDSDLSSVPDFLFNLELYVSALPGFEPLLSDGPIDMRSWRVLLATISGCFPPNTVASTWFRNGYQQGAFTSLHEFIRLFCCHFQQSASDLVSLQNRWEDASQRRNQSAYACYRFLLQLQAQIGSISVEATPTAAALTNKFCASVRVDLKRYLQEKRIDHPDYSISQLVSAASVRERSLRAGNDPVPALQSMQTKENSSHPKKWCFFCKSSDHTAEQCRKIAAKKAKGEWKERARPAKS